MSTEFKVGQVVYGDDFARLPVGSKIQSLAAFPAHFTKVSSGNAWAYTDGAGKTDSPASLDVGGPGRTLIYLPEPEPLAEWEKALLDEVDAENAVTINMLDREEIDRFVRAFPSDWTLVNLDGTIDSEVIDDMQAALREFANPKPARCTSLWSDGVRLWQCDMEADHDRALHDSAEGAASWRDEVAYGRVEVRS